MSEESQHRVGSPLGERAARERAGQVSVLGNPDTLRVLSALASGIKAPDIAVVLNADLSVVEQAIHSLELVDLIRSDDDVWVPTVDAWVRFGRLLLSESIEPTTPEAPVTALPRAVATVVDDLSYRFSSTFSRETVAGDVAHS